MKLCPKCFVEKFAHEFNKSKNRRDGLSYACKTCNSVYARCHYQCNKEDQKLKARIRRENIANNPAQIIIIEKLCSYCKIKKPVCDFGKDKYSVDKYINKCKQCKNELIRAQNRPEIERRKIERHNKIANRSAKKCNTCLLVKCLDEFYKNKNSVDNHVNTCKDCCRSLIDSDTYREERREYRLKNREKSNATQRKWYARRVLIDPTFRLRKAASKAIRCALKRAGGSKHGDSILQHLPYTLAELKTHIESQWEPWMSWDNYGGYDSSRKTWQIDHIIPQSVLPFADMAEENFQKLWALSNLRPLETIQNMKKSNKLAA